MTDSITFYTHPMSRGRVVRWALEEVGQPYRTEILEYGPPMKTPEHRARHPLGKVPALRHGEAIVFETAAICAYLAEAFAEAQLAPPVAEHAARAAYQSWLFLAAGPLEQAATLQACGLTLPEGKERMAGFGTYPGLLDAIESAVATTHYLAGNRFSMADLVLGSQLGFGMRFGSIENRPAFAAYVGRLTERPAFHRVEELDGALPVGA